MYLGKELTSIVGSGVNKGGHGEALPPRFLFCPSRFFAHPDSKGEKERKRVKKERKGGKKKEKKEKIK